MCSRSAHTRISAEIVIYLYEIYVHICVCKNIHRRVRFAIVILQQIF